MLFAGSLLLGALPSTGKSEDLLDPSILKRFKPSLGSSSDSGLAFGKRGSASRAMAANVVATLDNLTLLAASKLDEMEKLRKSIAALQARLRQLRDEMERVLDEYRSGMFCSGCGKTRSEILASGDKFPHPGQHIIKATEEQIDAKERALQSPITSGERQLHTFAKSLSAASRAKDEALEQIDAGVSLWSTSISYDALFSEKSLKSAEQMYVREKSELERKLAAAKNPDLQQKLNQLESEWSRKKREFADRKAKSAAVNSREQDEINVFLARGLLRTQNLAEPQLTFVSPATGFNRLGGMYKLGSLGDSNQTVPEVEGFVLAYQREGPVAAPDSLPGPPVMDRLKEQLRDMAKCHPGEPLCATRNVGTGRRG